MDNSGSRVTFDFIVFGCAFLIRERDVSLQNRWLVFASMLVFPLLTVGESDAQNVLFYEHPATSWMKEALPVGNGYLGAMVFGGVSEERIQFNEESLWEGGPGEWPGWNFGNRESGRSALSQVRQLLTEDKREQANFVVRQLLTGLWLGNEQVDDGEYFRGFGAYQPFGDLFVQVEQSGTTKDYRRSLDLDRGIAEVRYQSGRVRHHRRLYASWPSNVLVASFFNDSPNGLSYKVRLESLHDHDTTAVGNRITMAGNLTRNNMRFISGAQVRSDGRLTRNKDGSVSVHDARHVTILIVASTNYMPDLVGFDSGRPDETVAGRLSMLADKSAASLLEEHLSDFEPLMRRVTFRLEADGDRADMPTDERLRRVTESEPDPGLVTLFFHYARYLLASSSRPGTLPANLQGKWNDKVAPPWASDYHFNINVQMIYWPAEVLNLPETHEALLNYIKFLQIPGQRTVKAHYGDRGWTVHTMNNIFGYTAPGWDVPWGYFPGGGAWLCQHLYEHYRFNMDEDYLRNFAFPLMLDAAKFWLDYLQSNTGGTLTSSPSYSPEHGGISQGASMDHQIVWDLFQNILEAAKVLGVSGATILEIKSVQQRLLQPMVGRWGQLQEWWEDVDDPQNTHRHVSHLFALHPGRQISPEQTPELANAARASLEARGDGGTGWSLAWKINLWARLYQGDRAHRLLSRILRHTEATGIEYDDAQGTGVYDNLLVGTPFQLDATMGAAAGIAEMLLQSHTSHIHLLPALPGGWSTGEISGLRARGGIEVDLTWANAMLDSVALMSEQTQTVKLRYKTAVQSIELAAGDRQQFCWREERLTGC